MLREQLALANTRAERVEVARDVALAQLRMAEELLKEAQERVQAVEADAEAWWGAIALAARLERVAGEA